MAVLFILIIMGMRVIQSVNSKQVSLSLPTGTKAYVQYMAVYQGLAATFAAVLLLIERNFSGFDLRSVLIALCSGAFLTIGALAGIAALRGGTMVLQSVFSTAGLIVPCILGIFFFHEALSVVQVVCIVGVLASAVLLISSSKRLTGGFSPRTMVLLLVSFFSNGMVMFCQKLFGMIVPDGNVALFSMLTFLLPSSVLFVLGALLPCSDPNPDPAVKPRAPVRLIRCAVLNAFAVFVIQQLVTMLTPVMHSAVLFTLVNGSATIITAIVGAILYRERITVTSAAGIVVGVGALILINVF